MERLFLALAAILVAGVIAGPLVYSAPSDSGGDIAESQILPDVEGIYNNCLNDPFQEAGDTIQDPEIKQYYDHLMKDCDLGDQAPLEEESSTNQQSDPPA